MRRIALLSLVALTACPPKSQPKPGEGEKPRVEVKKDDKADQALKDAAAAAAQSKKKGIEAYLAVRKAYPESTAGQDALYQAGVLAFEEGDWVNARKALNELLFENPLYEKANDARLKSALAALELKAYRDAYQMLTALVDKLEGPDKQKAQEALERAAAGSQQYGEALKLALKAVDDAKTDADRKAALDRLQEAVEGGT